VEHFETGEVGGVELVDVGGGDDENFAGFGGEEVADLGADAVLDGAGVGFGSSGDDVGRH
jgi:hypothetical protein